MEMAQKLTDISVTIGGPTSFSLIQYHQSAILQHFLVKVMTNLRKMSVLLVEVMAKSVEDWVTIPIWLKVVAAFIL